MSEYIPTLGRLIVVNHWSCILLLGSQVN